MNLKRDAVIKPIKQLASEEHFHRPLVIARQRADLALRVFCRETAAALQFLLSSHGDRRIRCSRSELIH